MVPKTAFLEVLEDIHKRTDMRYGQIINNALQRKLGRTDCDCGRKFAAEEESDQCTCPNFNGAAYDIFSIRDEEVTKMLEEFRTYYLGDGKRKRAKPS